MSNIRNNYIHQTTHELVSKLPYRIVMEDLNVKSMMKNKHCGLEIDRDYNATINLSKYTT